MSKFNNLFNKPMPTNNASLMKPNSIFKDKDKSKPNYDYTEEAFPDLFAKKPVATVATDDLKKYSDVTSFVKEANNKKVEQNPVPPGWTGYSKSKGTSTFNVTHIEKKIVNEEEEKANNVNAHNLMMETLADNWSKYKIHYDKVHGEGEYDLLYYSHTVYSDDDYYSDGSSN